ncbi:helix-turn-helix transcriptional regulator [Massilia sp. NP310]|uniref:helix-turn-helix domain-containing protein n=1 Tax=Massilia sp. NP310 TaxID=2861282 RepID=UPI001C62CFBB|nr:helix-turn-helix transcriptional regulator [Massilia sp. NP310]QYG04048.1 helix-turn-helix domain-containing protein [Massilia sp. NP310]
MGRKVDIAHGVLDLLMERHGLKRDADVSRFLGVSPPVISKIRHGAMNMSGSVLLIAMEKGGLSFSDVRNAMGRPDGELCSR